MCDKIKEIKSSKKRCKGYKNCIECTYFHRRGRFKLLTPCEYIRNKYKVSMWDYN